ncbi:MAG TPA: alpha/beta fold hydrolase [Vicinamibacteria bacterium]|nr:alpha/beta fold hydrolase [Vicinamibacteria bacterium]
MTKGSERVTRAALAVAAAVSPAMAARWAEALFFTPPRPGKARAALPAGATRVDVQSRYGRLAVWSWGSGAAVYLVHGWGGRAEQLGAFVAPLVSRGFRVIAVDGPGHGASTGRRSSGVEIARALADVVAQLGAARAVIAHSLGAAAATFAVREGLRVERLVFIGAPADPLTWVERFGRRLGLSRAVMAEMRRLSEKRIQAHWEDLPLVPLRSLSASPPLLVVHDRDDREVPFTDGAAIAAAWPGARFLETSGLGHRRVLRDPAVVASIAGFVAGAEAGAAEDACVHGRPARDSGCEACLLEHELFVPARRRQAAPALAPR